MKRVTRTHFITGTGTGAGKTIFTALLLDHLRAQGEIAIAIKPICTGPRDDVQLLQSLQPGALSDDKMNPFYYQKTGDPTGRLAPAFEEGTHCERHPPAGREVRSTFSGRRRRVAGTFGGGSGVG